MTTTAANYIESAIANLIKSMSVREAICFRKEFTAFFEEFIESHDILKVEVADSRTGRIEYKSSNFDEIETTMALYILSSDPDVTKVHYYVNETAEYRHVLTIEFDGENDGISVVRIFANSQSDFGL